jgi:hypothetical protein
MSTSCTNLQFFGQYRDPLQTMMAATSTTAIMGCELKEVQIRLWHGTLPIGMELVFKTIHHQRRISLNQTKQAWQSLLQTAFQISGTNTVQGNCH